MALFRTYPAFLRAILPEKQTINRLSLLHHLDIIKSMHWGQIDVLAKEGFIPLAVIMLDFRSAHGALKKNLNIPVTTIESNEDYLHIIDVPALISAITEAPKPQYTYLELSQVNAKVQDARIAADKYSK